MSDHYQELLNIDTTQSPVQLFKSNPLDHWIDSLNYYFDLIGVYDVSPVVSNSSDSFFNRFISIRFDTSFAATQWFDSLSAISTIQACFPNDSIQLLSRYEPNEFNNQTAVDIAFQQHLNLMKIPEAWAISRGKPDIGIGVIEPGPPWTSHSELFPFSHPNASNQITSIFPNITLFPRGHISAVAGVIAAKANNGVAGAGIAHLCKVQTFSYNQASNAKSIIDNLLLAKQSGVKVINTSLATGRKLTNSEYGQLSKAYGEIAKDLSDNGIFWVSSAGNGIVAPPAPQPYPYENDRRLPASAAYVFSVSSVNENGYFEEAISGGYRRHHFNDSVDLCASGHNFAAIGHENNNPINEKWEFANGTSFAAPMVAGVAALMYSVNDCIDPVTISRYLKQTAESIVDDLPGEAFHNKVGAGYLNAYEAVKLARDGENIQLNPGLNTLNGPLFVGQDIIVHNGQILVIHGTLYFKEGVGIQVMPGGSVTLSPGAILTKRCEADAGRWKGIKLIGDPTLPTDIISQPRITANNATIEWADVAISVGDNSGIPGKGFTTIDQCIFRNNSLAIALYPEPLVSGLSRRVISRSTFIVDELDLANMALLNAIYAESNRNLSIIGCEFKNTLDLSNANLRNPGYGVKALNMTISLTPYTVGAFLGNCVAPINGIPNRFENLFEGVVINNSNDIDLKAFISESEFLNVTNAISISNDLNTMVYKNDIHWDNDYHNYYPLGCAECPESHAIQAIYSNQSEGFVIAENEILNEHDQWATDAMLANGSCDWAPYPNVGVSIFKSVEIENPAHNHLAYGIVYMNVISSDFNEAAWCNTQFGGSRLVSNDRGIMEGIVLEGNPLTMDGRGYSRVQAIANTFHGSLSSSIFLAHDDIESLGTKFLPVDNGNGTFNLINNSVASGLGEKNGVLYRNNNSSTPNADIYLSNFYDASWFLNNHKGPLVRKSAVLPASHTPLPPAGVYCGTDNEWFMDEVHEGEDDDGEDYEPLKFGTTGHHNNHDNDNPPPSGNWCNPCHLVVKAQNNGFPFDAERSLSHPYNQSITNQMLQSTDPELRQYAQNLSSFLGGTKHALPDIALDEKQDKKPWLNNTNVPNWSMYPNPTNARLIHINNKNNTAITLNLYNSTGQWISSYTVLEGNQAITLPELAAGVYWFRSDKGTQKLVLY